MTRKDFELIAKALNHIKPIDRAPADSHETWRSCVDVLCYAMQGTFPRFDSGKFRLYCLNGPCR